MLHVLSDKNKVLRPVTNILVKSLVFERLFLKGANPWSTDGNVLLDSRLTPFKEKIRAIREPHESFGPEKMLERSSLLLNMPCFSVSLELLFGS